MVSSSGNAYNCQNSNISNLIWTLFGLCLFTLGETVKVRARVGHEELKGMREGIFSHLSFQNNTFFVSLLILRSFSYQVQLAFLTHTFLITRVTKLNSYLLNTHGELLKEIQPAQLSPVYHFKTSCKLEPCIIDKHGSIRKTQTENYRERNSNNQQPA